MWNHIIKCEANLMEVIGKLRKLEKLLEISPPEIEVKFLYSLLTTICLLSVGFDIYYFHVFSKKAIRTFTFDTVDVHDVHWSIGLFAFIIYEFVVQYGYFFVNYFVHFYIIVCRYLMLILSKHVETNERIIKRRFTNYKNCDICFIRYDAILNLFHTVNSTLGFPIFLGIGYSACAILLSAMNIWNYQDDVSVSTICFLLSSFILFTATVFAASAVNETDKKAKRSNIRILQSLSNKERSQLKESIVGLYQMCYSPPFALTGWDIFEFTKSFYVASFGCFATYALLIINL